MTRPRRPCRHWLWTDPVYDMRVCLIHGEWAASLAWMNTRFGNVTEANAWTGRHAKTLWLERTSGTTVVLWFPKWFNVKRSWHLGVLAHESFHAAEFVLRERGLTLTDASDEAYAYYLAWIFRNCHERLL